MGAAIDESLPPGAAPKRPVAAAIVAALALAVGVYELVGGILTLLDADGASPLARAIFSVVFGIALLVVAFGAWRVRPWAWTAFMAWAVVGLAHQLLRHFFFEDPNYIAMALNTIAVFLLTPLDTQVAFGVRPPRNVQLAAPTRNPLDLD
jgi:hypothetical protein